MLAFILRIIFGLALATALAVAVGLVAWYDWPFLLAVVTGLLTPLVAHATLLGVEFVLTGWLGRDAKLPIDAQQIDLGSRIRAWLTEVPTAIRIFGLQMPWTGHRHLASASEPTRLSVVLIHGYFCNRAMFTELASHLAARGHAVESVNLEPIFGSIDQYPPIIDEAIKKARRDAAGQQLAIIGHSMGGVAARAYLRDFGDEAVAQVITLGSPHHGTELARIGHTKIVRQLRPGNAWLKALAESEPVGRYSRFTVVLSEHDNIVTPQRTQTLPGAKTVSFRGLGHVDLSRHPGVFKIIDEALDACASQMGAAGLRSTAEIT